MDGSDQDRAVRTVRLLWRHQEEQPRRRGPRPRRDLDAVLAAGIAIADSEGMDGVTIRRLADRLAISRMAVYNYVSDLDQLADLMTDLVHGELLDPQSRRFPYGGRSRPPAAPRSSWHRAARRVADANLELVQRHPWLVSRPNDRPVLGPNTTAKYEAELNVFEGLGLTDNEMDLSLWQLLNHVRGIAADQIAVERDAETTARWWQASAPAVADRITAERYPLATRVGTSVGAARQTAYDPLASYRFGLSRILDGLQTLIERR